MDIGTLDRRIRIEQPTVTKDATYGSATETWSTFATLWAQVQDVLPSKAESQGFGIRIAERPARIRTRYVSGITSDMRVVLLDRDNRIMKIITQPAEIGGRRDGLEFLVVDFTSSGDAA